MDLFYKLCISVFCVWLFGNLDVVVLYCEVSLIFVFYLFLFSVDKMIKMFLEVCGVIFVIKCFLFIGIKRMWFWWYINSDIWICYVV